MEIKKYKSYAKDLMDLMSKRYMLFMKVINNGDVQLLVLDSPKDILDILDIKGEQFETLIVRKKDNVITHSIVEAKQILQKELEGYKAKK